MANRKRAIPQYGIVTLNGLDYYRTRVQDADGKLVALYARTPEELYDKELNALEQIDNDTFCRKSPTVAEYCEKWLLMQSVHVRATTMTDYTSKVRRHIILIRCQAKARDLNGPAPFVPYGLSHFERHTREAEPAPGIPADAGECVPQVPGRSRGVQRCHGIV